MVTRNFTKSDWFGFAGCETKNPKIGFLPGFVVVRDGNYIEVTHSPSDYREDDMSAFYYEAPNELLAAQVVNEITEENVWQVLATKFDKVN